MKTTNAFDFKNEVPLAETSTTPLAPVGGIVPAVPTGTESPSLGSATNATTSAAEAIRSTTDGSRDPLTALLALVPVDKQAEANKHILALLTQARETGTPIDNRMSTLSLSKGKRYRLSERTPIS